jgi:hypothetical protein
MEMTNDRFRISDFGFRMFRGARGLPHGQRSGRLPGRAAFRYGEGKGRVSNEEKAEHSNILPPSYGGSPFAFGVAEPAIGNRQSAIRNPKSEIRNPKSEIDLITASPNPPAYAPLLRWECVRRGRPFAGPGCGESGYGDHLRAIYGRSW